MKVLAQKYVEKTLREIGKTGSKTSPKSYMKLVKTASFYRVQKYSRWASIPKPDDLSVDQPVDRPTVSSDRWGCRSIGRSTAPKALCLSVDRLVD